MAGSEPHLLLIGGDGGYSGVPTYLHQMARALAGQARLTIASDRNLGGYDFARDLPHVTHAEVAGLTTTLNPLSQRAARARLSDLIGGLGPDLVWPHARMAVHLTRQLALTPGLPPLAVTYHGLPFGPGHRPGVGQASRRVEAGMMRRLPPHHMVFLSQGQRDSFRATLGPGVTRHRAHVLENCSTLDPLPPDPREDGLLRLVMTGRAGFQKNLRAALALMQALPGRCHLTLCGAGTDGPGVRRLFAPLGGRVRFVGPVRDVRPYLAEAQAFLLTSRYEGMPIAALEAFEAGLPVILSDIPGTAEIRATHPACVTLDLARPAAVAPAALALMERPPAPPEAIHAAWSTRFSWGVWQRGLRDLVRDLLGPV